MDAYIHTNKSCCSPPLLTDTITTASFHFKSGYSQWSEPWLSCDNSGSGRPIHSTLIVAIPPLVPETNLIFSDISWISSIDWWVPFQYHTRLVWVYNCFQVFNQVRSESCRKKNAVKLYNFYQAITLESSQWFTQTSCCSSSILWFTYRLSCTQWILTNIQFDMQVHARV